MSETPTSFEDIDPDVLRRQAVEDWAVEVKPTDSLKKVVKALDEAGVDWDAYAERYGYEAEDAGDALDAPDSVEPVQAAVTGRTPEGVRQGAAVTTQAMKGEQAFRTAQPVAADGELPFLVKMERDNERYDVRGYSFTKRHPYALVKPKDLEYVLKHEPGFRQAYPSEVAEFYNK